MSYQNQIASKVPVAIFTILVQETVIKWYKTALFYACWDKYTANDSIFSMRSWIFVYVIALDYDELFPSSRLKTRDNANLAAKFIKVRLE